MLTRPGRRRQDAPGPCLGGGRGGRRSSRPRDLAEARPAVAGRGSPWRSRTHPRLPAMRGRERALFHLHNLVGRRRRRAAADGATGRRARGRSFCPTLEAGWSERRSHASRRPTTDAERPFWSSCSPDRQLSPSPAVIDCAGGADGPVVRRGARPGGAASTPPRWPSAAPSPEPSPARSEAGCRTMTPPRNGPARSGQGRRSP